jgi:hypothetical protein
MPVALLYVALDDLHHAHVRGSTQPSDAVAVARLLRSAWLLLDVSSYGYLGKRADGSKLLRDVDRRCCAAINFT